SMLITLSSFFKYQVKGMVEGAASLHFNAPSLNTPVLSAERLSVLSRSHASNPPGTSVSISPFLSRSKPMVSIFQVVLVRRSTAVTGSSSRGGSLSFLQATAKRATDARHTKNVFFIMLFFVLYAPICIYCARCFLNTLKYGRYLATGLFVF